MSKPTWLPNLVGGVSIWKLASDLNQANFFAGRLLVPETEGSDSLPSRVTWDLAGLVPLSEARKANATEVEQAVGDFIVCLDRASKEFGDPASGYHKFKDALTFPMGLAAGTEGDDESYFFDSKSKQVRAINWGATARTLAGQEVRVFSFVNWSALAKAAVPAVAAAGVIAAATPAIAAAPTEAETKDEEQKEEKKEEEKKKRPWWIWLLAALFAIALVVLLLWLLKGCNEANVASLEAGADAAADGDAALAADALAADAQGEAAGDSGGDGEDGAVDASAHDGAADGSDGSGSGGGGGTGGGGGGGTGGGGGGGTGGGGGGTGGGTELPHRVHFHPDATEWRIVKGGDLVADKDPPDGKGDTFRVTLKRGSTFQNLAVEWKDKAGKWHTF